MGWSRRERTRDVFVENVIFLDNVVDNFLAGFVENKYFPLHLKLESCSVLIPSECANTHVFPCNVRNRFDDDYIAARNVSIVLGNTDLRVKLAQAPGEIGQQHSMAHLAPVFR